MPLTDTTIRNAKPGEKPHRLFELREITYGGHTAAPVEQHPGREDRR